MLRGLFLTLPLLSLMLCGCGLSVPQLKQPPNNYNDAQNNAMVEAIIASIRCELKTAITTTVNNDINDAIRNGMKPSSQFLNDWGVESLLTLTIKEETTFSPSAILTSPANPSPFFSISGGLSARAAATRIEKINSFYTIKELYMPPGTSCSNNILDASGSLLISSNLRIADILAIKLDSIAAKQSSLPIKSDKNVLSHEITFQSVFSGDVTPSWKLVRATVNPSQLFSTNRDQTHDVILTFGPLAKPDGGRSLIAIAEQTHIASQTTSGFLNAIRLNALMP